MLTEWIYDQNTEYKIKGGMKKNERNLKDEMVVVQIKSNQMMMASLAIFSVVVRYNHFVCNEWVGEKVQKRRFFCMKMKTNEPYPDVLKEYVVKRNESIHIYFAVVSNYGIFFSLFNLRLCFW